MANEWARSRLADARVARLATCDADGAPHLVPVVFALTDDVLITAVDAKPKSGARLRRLSNIAANPRVSVLVDHYDDADWSRLWWVRADGTARILDIDDAEAAGHLAALIARYPQYRSQSPPGPAIVITVHHWSGWAADAAEVI